MTRPLNSFSATNAISGLRFLLKQRLWAPRIYCAIGVQLNLTSCIFSVLRTLGSRNHRLIERKWLKNSTWTRKITQLTALLHYESDIFRGKIFFELSILRGYFWVVKQAFSPGSPTESFCSSPTKWIDNSLQTYVFHTSIFFDQLQFSRFCLTL